jgi:hypothetical protein
MKGSKRMLLGKKATKKAAPRKKAAARKRGGY